MMVKAACVSNNRRRFGRRSMRTPAGMPSTSEGANWQTPISPSAAGELVMVNTNQLWARLCIQVPVSEMSWQNQKMR